ncbi:MAG: EAL domain-containing protein [Desulfurivibrionaceae bacterium]|jgi:EAL domain-containing protein (putative c-di-GMP-specific phosphodiesterase class I)
MPEEVPDDLFRNILAAESIRTDFQPIVSLIRQQVVGIEALSRGIDPETGAVIAPLDLFRAGERLNCNLELDRLCRKTAVTTFSRLADQRQLLLFLNFNPGVLDEGVVGSRHLQDLFQRLHIHPSQIALEIVESKVKSRRALLNFVRFYREIGCMIVLDDFGEDQSNLERVASLRPDIIKISRNLVDGITYDYFKQSVVAAIISLAGKIGSLVLAEGVERFDDIMICHEIGADLMQGYYFSKPKPAEKTNANDCCLTTMQEVAKEMQSRLAMNYRRNIQQQEEMSAILTKVISLLITEGSAGFDRVLHHVISNCREVQCFYILDNHGTQVSKTIFLSPPTPRNSLFEPAAKGAVHTLKDYYLTLVQSGTSRFCTEPYISLASGNICRTMSFSFSGLDKKPYILCADF